MLSGLFVAPAVAAVGEALQSAHADGTLAVAVIGHAKLAAGLTKLAKHPVLAVGLAERAAKKVPGALPDLSTIEAGSLAAVIGIDVVDDEGWETAIREWSRVVKDGGVIVFVDRGHAPEASRRALCGGLTELEQRRAGRLVITSGLVSHLS
jgi:hypothetical protein